MVNESVVDDAASCALTFSQRVAVAQHAHNWLPTVPQATALQRELALRVSMCDQLGVVRHVAGIDVGFEQNGAIARAAVAVLAVPDLQLVETRIARLPVTFPYVPGYLSFRELPAVLAALSRLEIAPDLILCDGQGIAHPRRFGIAAHLGVLLDLPTIGVGKTRLCGEYQEPGDHKGDWSALIHKDERIGAVLRTRPGTKPLFVSVGHKLSLQSALNWVLACTTRYRLPEATRAAHRAASGPEKASGRVQ